MTTFHIFSKRVNELRRLHTLSGTRAESQVELPPLLLSGDAARDALLPPPTGIVSMLDRAFKGGL